MRHDLVSNLILYHIVYYHIVVLSSYYYCYLSLGLFGSFFLCLCICGWLFLGLSTKKKDFFFSGSFDFLGILFTIIQVSSTVLLKGFFKEPSKILQNILWHSSEYDWLILFSLIFWASTDKSSEKNLTAALERCTL